MTSLAQRDAPTLSTARRMLNKVPEVTVYFWIIKILATTVGETGADYLDANLGFGLTNTTYLVGALLLVALAFQFRARKYVPSIYWLAVVLISVVGTLITDNLTDDFGVALTRTTTLFSIALAVTFAVWYRSERTLSIHTIDTTRREAFYWLAILFTFALGTAAGDLLAERLSLGYPLSALMFAAAIAVVFIAHVRFQLNAVLAFWIAYVLTRPLGASLGDLLSQPRADGGLGLGTTVTSLLFLATILGLVTYLSITKVDEIPPAAGGAVVPPSPNDEARVLVVTNKASATQAIVEAVRARAATGPATFFMLVPNPAHLAFDRPDHGTDEGEQVLAQALPLLEAPAGTTIEGRVAASPNAFDGIVDELNARPYDEIILETPPIHMSHWLHVDLPDRIARLGYPVTAVAATRA